MSEFDAYNDESDLSDSSEEEEVTDDELGEMEEKKEKDVKYIKTCKPSVNDEESDEEEESDEKVAEKEFDSKKPEDLLAIVKTTGYKKNSFPSQVSTLLKQCEYCTKYYRPDITVNMGDSLVCHYCYFWTHYNEAVREEGDGKNGIFVADFIETCREDHDMTDCANSPMYGFCFICDFFHGDSLEWIKKRNILFGEKNNDKDKNSSYEGSDEEFTVEI